MVDQDTHHIMTLGKYKVVRELGRGATGIVYEGFDPILERRVALKTIRKDLLQTSGREDAEHVLQRFRREAQAAARLQHPNIVMAYDYAEEGETVFIAMELVRGRELKSYFAQKQRFDLNTALDIMFQLLDGLAYSHRHNVVHRDIKPSNIILIDGSGQVKIADFGVARVDTSNLTQTGDIMGTPTHMAPEQLLGRPVDGRADLFSAGVVLYELLTGEMPFTGGNLTALMHNVLTADPPSPCQFNAHLPAQCEAVVDKALAKDAAARYQSAEEFQTALQGLRNLAAAPVSAAPPTQAGYRKGILGDLRKEADQARLLKEAEAARLAKLEEIYRNELCPRLLSIHGYLFDLVEQLKTLSWSVETEYDFPGIGKVAGLAQENYRVHIDSMDNPKRVVLTFTCRAPDERRYAVETSKADETHKFFVSQQIKHMDWPARNIAGQIKETIFQARLQIQVAVVCHADIAKSKIVVGVTNMEGISTQRHEYKYTEIDEEWLDRMGNYVLRKLDSIGKIYITEEERQALRAHLARERERLQIEGEPVDDQHEGEKSSIIRGLRRKLFAPGHAS